MERNTFKQSKGGGARKQPPLDSHFSPVSKPAQSRHRSPTVQMIPSEIHHQNSVHHVEGERLGFWMSEVSDWGTSPQRLEKSSTGRQYQSTIHRRAPLVDSIKALVTEDLHWQTVSKHQSQKISTGRQYQSTSHRSTRAGTEEVVEVGLCQGPC